MHRDLVTSHSAFSKALSLTAATCTLSAPLLAAGASNPPPNIVIFLADDAGYADFSSFGSKFVKTPNFDTLGKQGMRFTDFYAAGPVCSPSRVGLMTGRIPARCGMYSFIPEGRPTMHLTTKEITIPHILKQKGYDTCHIGKWHMSHILFKAGKRYYGGPEGQPQPQDFGFDYSFGTTNNALEDHRNPHNFVRNGVKIKETQGYSCQILADEGIDWLKNRKDKSKPFFLYVAFHEPHETVAAPPELVEKFTSYKNDNKKLEVNVRTYFATIENMDNAAGRLLKHLDETGLADNTLVLFYSDNGSRESMSKAAQTNAPLRGQKADVWDGGIRSPAVMRWPAVIKPGSVCHEPLGAIDMMPTIAAITGAPLPADRPMDGVNVLPLLKGEKINREKPLFWFMWSANPAVAMRDGDWTLVGYINKPEKRIDPRMNPEAMAYIKSAQLQRFELYDVRNDIGQKINMAEKEPERFARMKKQMSDLFTEVIAEGPTWTQVNINPFVADGVNWGNQ